LKIEERRNVSMELIIKAKLINVLDIEKLVKQIRETEKEYSCNCTLLEIEIE
jgi:hypothetical protein